MGKTAIILGATGLTGSLVLEQLLVDDRYERILLFSRSSCGVDHPKLTEYLGDLLHLEEFKEQFKGDEVYVCIGTTRKKTPDPDEYRKIDFGIPGLAICILFRVVNNPLKDFFQGNKLSLNFIP